MRILPLLLVLLGVAACASPSGDDALEPAQDCAPGSSAGGPSLLQEPARDVPGPFYSARTDGPCELLVTFTGAPEGDGPCNVAEYVGRLEPDGEDLRLVVEPSYTGPQPDGDTACPSIGAGRQLRVTLEAPLGERRVVGPQGHPISLVDGDQLLRFGTLPDGWVEGPEGQAVFGPVHWSFTLRGPGGAHAELRQGGPKLAEPGPKAFGYRELGRPSVRGTEALLVSFEEEAPGNHVLTWVEGDRGFALQVMGPLPDPQVLVEVANGLDTGGEAGS